MDLQTYTKKWADMYRSEQQALKALFNDELVAIEHIGSTAISKIKSKPIIDTAIIFREFGEANNYIDRLRELGYEYSPERSSSERYFFSKGNPAQYHLSIANPETSYLQRQVAFRDHLIDHPDIAKEYEALKLDLIKKYPSGKKEYSYGKNEFIAKVLELADAAN